MRYHWALALLPLAGACGDTGQAVVEIPLSVSGSESPQALELDDGLSLTLDEARVAFGPLFLCAGTTSGELCDAARLEWLDSAEVDLLDPARRDVGSLRGVSGSVCSWMFDYGYSWPLTSSEPVALTAARRLDGASVRLSGVLNATSSWLPFEFELKLVPLSELRGIPTMQSTAGELSRREVNGSEEGLEVHFSPAPWLTGLPWRLLSQNVGCDEEAEAVRCAGSVEQRCLEHEVQTSRDCAAQGEFCLADVGCVDRLDFGPGSEGAEGTVYRAFRQAVSAGHNPKLNWHLE